MCTQLTRLLHQSRITTNKNLSPTSYMMEQFEDKHILHQNHAITKYAKPSLTCFELDGKWGSLEKFNPEQVWTLSECINDCTWSNNLLHSIELEHPEHIPHH